MHLSLPQWLLVTSKKICKWVLCLVVAKNYYENLRVMSVTSNIRVFITFNMAVTMVRCSGSCTNIFYWISSLTFWKVGPRRPIASEFTLTRSFIRKKFHHKCSWHRSVKCNQAPFSFQTVQTYFESSTPVKIYNGSYIFFSEEILPKHYINALNTVFTDAKN